MREVRLASGEVLADSARSSWRMEAGARKFFWAMMDAGGGGGGVFSPCVPDGFGALSAAGGWGVVSASRGTSWAWRHAARVLAKRRERGRAARAFMGALLGFGLGRIGR